MALLRGQASDVWPEILASVNGPALSVGDTVDWELPAGWAAQMTAGVAGGIGVVGSGVAAIIDGPHADLHISWTRTVA